jgi:hypothetical protein
MNFFDYWWIPFIVAASLGLGGWSMWLEHKRKEKALDVLREAIASGRDVPPPLMRALTREVPGGDDDWTGCGFGGGGQSGIQGAVFFALLAIGFGLAAWFKGGGGWNPFWLVAGIMAAMAIMAGVNHYVRRSRSERP